MSLESWYGENGHICKEIENRKLVNIGDDAKKNAEKLSN